MRRKLPKPRNGLPRRGDVLGQHAVSKLSQQQWIAAGDFVTRGAELVVGVPGERLAEESGGGAGAERRGPNDGRKRVGDHLAEEGNVRSLLGRPESDHDQELEGLCPRQEIREPAQGRQVAPVQVVDHDQGRATRRDIRREPVEAVKDGQ